MRPTVTVAKRSPLPRVLGGACLILGVVIGYGVSRGVLAAGPGTGSATEPSGAYPISLTPTIVRPASPDLLARGKGVYDRQCAACHGLTGQGDGEAARSGADVHPRILGTGQRQQIVELFTLGGAGAEARSACLPEGLTLDVDLLGEALFLLDSGGDECRPGSRRRLGSRPQHCARV